MSQAIFRNAFALAAISILWLISQTVFNAFFYFLGSVRGDGAWWFFFMKNILSPGIAAYLSFAVAASYISGIHWRFLLIGFLVVLISITAWGTGFNAEYYLSAQRIDDWREVFFGALASAISSAIAAFMASRELLQNKE